MRLLLIPVILTVIAISGCVSDQVIPLDSVEITNYEGEQLTPITSIRDVSIAGPQNISISEYRLEVIGLVNEPKSYTYDEVLSNQKYSKVVTINCVLGWSSKNLWEGVLVKDVIGDVSSEANTVIFHAHDGYTTSHPLDYIRDNNILLAYKVNNVTLTPKLGYPFMLVAEEKWGYKWIKWITKIELSNDPDYRGYWEQRGYSIEGDIDGSFYG